MKRMLGMVLALTLVIAGASSAVTTGIFYGSQTLIYQGYGFGDHFDLSTGMIVPDTIQADLTLISGDGTNIGNEGTQIPGPMLLLLPDANLDSVMSVPAYIGDVPWIDNSWDFTYGTMGAPISVGQVWVVYTREGNYGVIEVTGVNVAEPTSLTFDWKYQPNGTTDFTDSASPERFVVTQTMPNDGEMDVDIGLMGITAVFDRDVAPQQSGVVVVEGSMSGIHNVMEIVQSPGIGWALSPAGFAPGETVTVSLSGYEDVSGTVMEPYVFSFETFVEGYSLHLTLLNFDSYIGLPGHIRVIGLDDGMERARDGGLIDSSTVNIDLPGVFGDGGSFIVDLWIDVNNNGYYDGFPDDHSWRVVYRDVSSDVVDSLTHNTDYVDIQWESNSSDGGLIMGTGTIDNIASTPTIAGFFDFADGVSQFDTSYAHV
jgi:hypothetical protein